MHSCAAVTDIHAILTPVSGFIYQKVTVTRTKSQIKFWDEGIASSALTPFPFFWQWDNSIFLRLLISASVSATPWESLSGSICGPAVFFRTAWRGLEICVFSTGLMPSGWTVSVILGNFSAFSHSTWHLFVIDLIFCNTI